MPVSCLFCWQEGSFLTAGDSLRGLKNQTQKMASSPAGQRAATAHAATNDAAARPSDRRHGHPGRRGGAGAGFLTLTHVALHVRYAGQTLKRLKVGKVRRTSTHQRGEARAPSALCAGRKGARLAGGRPGAGHGGCAGASASGAQRAAWGGRRNGSAHEAEANVQKEPDVRKQRKTNG